MAGWGMDAAWILSHRSAGQYRQGKKALERIPKESEKC
jgi:hypothetical protein